MDYIKMKSLMINDINTLLLLLLLIIDLRRRKKYIEIGKILDRKSRLERANNKRSVFFLIFYLFKCYMGLI